MEQAIQPIKSVPEGEISFEEFLAWGNEDTHAEWVKGRVMLKMLASVKHRDSNSFLHLLVGNWIIDPERQHAEFAQLDEHGVYQGVFSGSRGVYHSQVLNGFWLQVEWLWQQPALWEVFKAWGLV